MSVKTKSKIGKRTQKAWDKIYNELNGGGCYISIIDEGDFESLEELIDKLGMEEFVNRFRDSQERDQDSYREEVYDRSKDSFSGSLSQLERDKKKLDEQIFRLVSGLRRDYPEHQDLLKDLV